MTYMIQLAAVLLAIGQQARPGVTVTGRVFGKEGIPIAGARVSWAIDWRVQTGIRDVTTDTDGRFVLERVLDDPIVLTVEAAGHSPELRQIPADAARKPMEFRLGPGHMIRGRIVDTQGRPIAGAPISVQDWRGHSSLKWSTRTDGEGRFRWEGAPADVVMIDLGQLGFKGKRIWQMAPDQPENTITMRRPLRVRGRVTDAETHRPIKTFRFVPGGMEQNASEIWWDYDEERQVSGLSYDVNLSTTTPIRVIRVEADGYLPAVSRPIKADEGEAIVHFALTRGEGTSGVVRLADGSPMAGAIAILATPSRPLLINNGRPPAWQSGPHTFVRTRADGRFQLAPQAPPFTIVVLHDRAYAEADFNARPTGPIELTARPWAHVEGTLRFGSRPAPRESLGLSTPADPGTRPNRVVSWYGYATTDADGRFTFDRVAEGTYRISRNVSLGEIGSNGGSPSADVDVRPGKTTHIDLGRTGRPVVGKAVPPAVIAGRPERAYGFCYLIRKPITRDTLSLTFAVEDDGSFRIEAVEPGTYEILILLRKREANRVLTNETLASVRREIVVPPVPGGSSDQPIDLGTIHLEAVKP